MEARVYQILVSEGFNPEYESKTILLWEGFTPTVPYYKKTKRALNCLEKVKVRNITYTPDFYFKYNDVDVYIEVKGFVNDTFPIKKKMFRKYLETQPTRAIVFEIYTLTQLKDAITKIRQYGQQT
jgi:predicted nuclease of restriction endonuclease-like RecB superfamily